MQKKKSLKDYWILFIIIIINATLIINISNYFFLDKNFNDNIENRKKNSSRILIEKFDESLIYIENFANFIGKRIAHEDNNKPEVVAQILQSIKPNIDHVRYNIFTWTLFDFVNPKGYVIAASSFGVINNPELVTKEKRSWMTTAKEEVFKLQFSKKDIGIISNEPILPAALGVEGKSGFLGYVTLGANINKMMESFQVAVADKVIKFIIFDQDFNRVLSSQNSDSEDVDQIHSYLLNNKNNLKLNEPFAEEGKNYYLANSPNYPFLFVVGVDEKIVRQEFWLQFFPKVSNTLYLTIFFLILLYFFRTKLLKPVIELSEATKQISSKNFDALVPDSDIYEINILADSIREVKQFLRLEEKEKEKLRKQKNKAEQENFGKTEFLSATVHDLKNHLVAIIGVTDLMKNNLNEKHSPAGIKIGKKELSDNIQCLDDISNSTKELSNLVEDILDINQAGTGNFKIEIQDKVDLGGLILRSVKLLTTRAGGSKQKIICNIDNDSKKIIGILLDPRRVKQILANLISNSIKYSPPHTVIEVCIRQLTNAECVELYEDLSRKITNNRDLNVKDSDKIAKILGRKLHNRVSIIVKDHGFGMDEDEIKVALSKYGVVENDNSGKVDSTGLGLPIVKYLVEAQGGAIRIKSKKGEGTEVEIII